MRLVIALAALAPWVARAQDNYEIQVYGAHTVARDSTMFELHSNFTADGRRAVQGGLWPTEDAEHETLEITHGWTPWFETGFYVFTYASGHEGWQWIGDHIRPRIRVPDSWNWPVGVSLSTEVGYQRPRVSQDTWTWEIRPIIDQTIGRWYWAINPDLERSFKGPTVTQGFVFAPNATVGYDVTKKVNLAAEYYASYGAPQQQQLFGCINLDFGPQWEFNFGVGNGWTSATDHVIIKMILGRRVGF
ncbi:MAG TPA: hypothetical protein VFA43_05135 [Gemmatimonadaceae bacterium]|nr:hypothetical protein [Gemmatimonadaceae bacterium]